MVTICPKDHVENPRNSLTEHCRNMWRIVIVEELWRTVEDCGGLWRSVEVCGGPVEDCRVLWRTVEDCGGLWRTVEDCRGL